MQDLVTTYLDQKCALTTDTNIAIGSKQREVAHTVQRVDVKSKFLWLSSKKVRHFNIEKLSSFQIKSVCPGSL